MLSFPASPQTLRTMFDNVSSWCFNPCEVTCSEPWTWSTSLDPYVIIMWGLQSCDLHPAGCLHLPGTISQQLLSGEHCVNIVSLAVWCFDPIQLYRKGGSFGSGGMSGLGGSFGSGDSFGYGDSSGVGVCSSRRSYSNSRGSCLGNCGLF